MSNTGDATTTAKEQEEQDNQTSTTEQQSQADTTINTPSAAAQESPQHQTTTGEQTSNAAEVASEPKPDVSDQGYQELLPKLMNYFHNNREELARALGLHRSTVDRWLNGKSRPNNSTILRMRRLAQERRIE
jgi:hypothetical protein